MNSRPNDEVLETGRRVPTGGRNSVEPPTAFLVPANVPRGLMSRSEAARPPGTPVFAGYEANQALLFISRVRQATGARRSEGVNFAPQRLQSTVSAWYDHRRMETAPKPVLRA